jgi:hypothetical protein
MDPPVHGQDAAEDPELARRLTDGLMERLTLLVDDLRSGYPKRWA